MMFFDIKYVDIFLSVLFLIVIFQFYGRKVTKDEFRKEYKDWFEEKSKRDEKPYRNSPQSIWNVESIQDVSFMSFIKYIYVFKSE